MFLLDNEQTSKPHSKIGVVARLWFRSPSI